MERRELGEDVATSLEEDQELHEGEGEDVEFHLGRSGKKKNSGKMKSKRGVSPLNIEKGNKRAKDNDFLPAQADDFEFDFDDEGDGIFDAPPPGIKNRKEEKVKASATSKRNTNLPGVVPPAALKTTISSGTTAGIRSQSGQERNNKGEAFIFNRTASVGAAAAHTGLRNNNNDVDVEPLIQEVVAQDVDEHQHDEQDLGKIEQNNKPSEGLSGGQQLQQGNENENQVNFEDQTSSDGIIASDSEEGRWEEGRPQDDGRSRPNESTAKDANAASGIASQNAPAADEEEDDHYWDDMFEA